MPENHRAFTMISSISSLAAFAFEPRVVFTILVGTGALYWVFQRGSQSESEKKEQLAYERRFLRAKDRKFLGMTLSTEFAWQGEYDFVCMGDPQIGMGDQKIEEEFSRRAVRFINSRKARIKFVIVCGDHTHNLEDIWSKKDIVGGRKKEARGACCIQSNLQ